MKLSSRLRSTAEPAIPAARTWAARYSGQAGPALDLTQAVPGYPPHPALLAKLSRAAGDAAFSGYGPIDGDPALRAALAAEMTRYYGAFLETDDVAITAGGNLAFSMVMAVLCDQGDKVALPVPWYFNHQMALTMLGVAVLPLPCRAEQGFVPSAAAARALLAQGARVLVLVTPNNPTGAVYPPSLIEELAAACREAGAWLVLDETYRDFLAEAQSPPHALFSNPSWRDHVVHLYSFSKAYCVPGHRVGAVVCGPAVRAELVKALDTWQICPPRAAQHALAWAVPTLLDWRQANRDLMADRAEAFRAAVAPLQGWQLDALGAYFAYLRLPEDSPDAMTVAETLAAERGLMCLPGPFFGPGQQRHLRLAFANVGLDAIAAVPCRLRV